MALISLLQMVSAARRSAAAASLAVVEVTMTAGQMTPLHAHADEEAFQIIEGTIVVYSDAGHARLSAGDTHVVPAGVPHTVRAEAATVRYVAATFVSSVGRYEQFVQAVTQPGDLGPSAAGLEVIARGAGTTVLGSPGDLPATLALSVA